MPGEFKLDHLQLLCSIFYVISIGGKYNRMREIRKKQAENDRKMKEAKKSWDDYEKDCKKSGGGKNALAPPPGLDPDDCK